MTYTFYIGDPDDIKPSRKYNFKTFRVYIAYRHYIAEQVDEYFSKTPVKTKTGFEIQPTNYKKDYE